MSGEWIDIGDGHSIKFTRWAPDRDLNPQFKGVPDIDPCGIIWRHPDLQHPGETHTGSALFDLPGMAEHFRGRPRWQVQSLQPLTLSPSIHCKPPEGCGAHGFIQNGRWVQA